MCNKNYNFVTPFDFYKDDNKVLYSRDRFGFRGRYKDIDKIDIIVVGGSTTDERFIKLEDTWTEKLEKNFLKDNKIIDVVNAGLDGQSTYGHIWNFENWFNKLENFKPKYILFYIGINDSLLISRGLALKHYDNHIGIPTNWTYLKKIKYYLKKNNGITYKLAHAMYKKFYLKDTYVISKRVSHLKRNPNYQLVSENYEITKYYKKFLPENLKKLHNYSIEFGSTPIFITQKSLMGKMHNKKYYSINKTNIYLHEKAASIEIMNYCEENNLLCLDLNKEINFVKDDVYDLAHTTPKGSLKISNYIYERLKDKLIF